MLLSAELARSYGEIVARIFLNAHEVTGNLGGQTADAANMDLHNNDLGINIGVASASRNEVLQRVRDAISNSNGAGDGARWLPPDQWATNPTDDQGNRLPNDDPRLNWPVPQWPDGGFGFPGSWDFNISQIDSGSYIPTDPSNLPSWATAQTLGLNPLYPSSYLTNPSPVKNAQGSDAASFLGLAK